MNNNSHDYLTALGLMSGTSMDGIDLAVIVSNGERIKSLGATATIPYLSTLRDRLSAAIMQPDKLTHAERNSLSQALTSAHSTAIDEFFQQHGLAAADFDLIGFHGHTLVHRPEHKTTVQLGNGGLLAQQTGITVVNDFRSNDMAHGGQGAPLAPLYHAALARDLAQPVGVLNLGGVGNVTYLEGNTIIAFDTGPGNALLDDWVTRHTGQSYDQDGRIALSGQTNSAQLKALLNHPFFSQPAPKSLDRNAFSLAAISDLTLADGAATLASFTAASVAAALPRLPAQPKQWLVTGGGRHNPAIMSALRQHLQASVEPVEQVGWNGDALEAQAFGFLAVRSLYGMSLSLPGTTGVSHPVTGGVVHHP